MGNIYVNSLRIDRSETFEFEINGHLVRRQASLGLSLMVTRDTPETDRPNSLELYKQGNRALNLLFEQEKENFLSELRVRTDHAAEALRIANPKEEADDNGSTGKAEESTDGYAF